MKLRPILFIGILVIVLVFFGLSLPAQAAPPGQGISFATNTPAPNGNIYYIVQANDNCTRIAHLYNITVEQIIGFNSNLNANCDLIAGEKLFVGTGGPSSLSPTPGPSPTPLPPTITPTPFAGTTQICVLLFNDMNGDALREATEPVIPGGAISVTETNGKYSKTLPTAVNSDPTAYQGTCFNDLPEGHYNIAAAIPDNYNPTMNLTYTLDLKPGDSAFVDFGAQSRDTTITQPQPTTSGGDLSPVLGIFGGVLLLGGVGLGWYALRLRRPRSKLQQSGLLKK
jgi:LysM domain